MVPARLTSRTALTLAAATALAGAVTAHEDDPKTLDREAPFASNGLRTTVSGGSGMWNGSTVPGFPQFGVELLSWLPLSTFNAAGGMDCWGYVSPSGREYAIIATDKRSGFVEITDPRNPTVLPSVNGPNCGWRDMKVYGEYAYLVDECDSGIQVVDLSNIDSGAVTQVGTVTAGGSLDSHNVAINEDSGYLYRCGGDGNGLRIYDLNTSVTNPPYVGAWNTKYVHDAQIVSYTSGPAAGKEIAYACSGFNNGWSSTGLTILDVTNKSNISVMKEVFWPSAAYSHQAWLSEDRQYLYVNDEVDEETYGVRTTTFVMDVSDPANAFLAFTFDNNSKATGHNLYVRDDLLLEANYRSGLRIFDLAVNPQNPPEIAWFDTYETTSTEGYNGLWSNFPYFPSGLVIGSDMEKGLFVFWVGERPVDYSWPAGEPMVLSSYGDTHTVQITEQVSGDLVAGTEKLHYDAGVGVQTVPLNPLGGGLYEVNFPATPCGTSVQWYLTAKTQNGVSWTEPVPGASLPYVSESALNAHLVHVDDMEIDLGWTISGGATAGAWELGDPVGSSSQPEDDHTIAGVNCWYTSSTSNVNGGTTRLASPAYDLSTYANPLIGYWRYYVNNQGGVPGEDPFTVEVSDDGVTWILVETVGPSSLETVGGWIHHSFKVSDFVAPNATIQVRFNAMDTGGSSRVEAAVDDLTIHDLGCGPVNYCTAGTSANGCQATLASTGTPSATATGGFTLDATGVEGAKDGLYFFGTNGRQANPWGSGSSFQCVVPPVSRGGLLGSTGTAGACDGSFTQDLNALWCATCPRPGKNPGAGAQVGAQLWYRDPMNTSNQTTSLSDAIEFTVGP